MGAEKGSEAGPAVEVPATLMRGPWAIGPPAPEIESQLSAAEPYRPDTVADGGMAFGLTVRAASVRGLLKRYTGGPRQDDFCLRRHDDTQTLIVAVADGVSGAPRSHLGAALAVRHATAATLDQLERGEADIDWAAVFDRAAWALIDEQRRASGDPEAGIEAATAELATTLVVATISGERVQLAGVGDSPALTLDEGAFEPVLVDPRSEDGFVGGRVDALPRAARDVRSDARELRAGQLLLLCTDGLALPLGDGTGDVGQALARELLTAPDVIDFARLLDFSRNTYDDDRTLVAVWAGG